MEGVVLSTNDNTFINAPIKIRISQSRYRVQKSCDMFTQSHSLYQYSIKKKIIENAPTSVSNKWIELHFRRRPAYIVLILSHRFVCQNLYYEIN